jgi:hypothetical protein
MEQLNYEETTALKTKIESAKYTIKKHNINSLADFNQLRFEISNIEELIRKGILKFKE